MAAAAGSRVVLSHDVLGSVIISRRKGLRRISISISAGGDVRLNIPIGGDERRAMEFLESKIEWVVAAREKVAKRVAAGSNQRELTAAEVEHQRVAAKGYLPRRTAELAAHCGFKYGRLTLRATRSKWGCCTGANNLSLSIFLMQVPKHLIDFVILHELTHTIHHNHSAQFHAALDHILGGREREYIKELKLYRPGFVNP